MKHARWLIGLILVLAAAACGSGSGTRPIVAQPGQRVPASAIHRLTAIADRAVTANGGHPAAWATAVVTTQTKAQTLAFHSTPGDSGAMAIVYLVSIKGEFVCGACTRPAGGHAATDTYLLLIIDAKTFEGNAFGISPKPPPSPALFGPVTYLTVHPHAKS